MTKPLTVYHPHYRNGVTYFREHAEIMRIVWGLKPDDEVVRFKRD